MNRNHWLRRALLSLMVASIATIGIAGAVSAHECFNDSRNARADANAANSNGWSWASETLLQFVIPGIIGDADGLTDAELAVALATVEVERASGDFDAVYAFDRAINDHATAMGGKGVKPSKADDDHAIEHATADEAEFGPLVNHLIGIYMAVSS